ncbi:MAG: argininosuccinate lyase [Armatimonadota bacterium]|nr:argininosuccinate lyase [Armatimonadota bacterium]MDR7561748.1 argininosuccinate lyase [Armatimonadota bacterium]
MGKLWEKGYRLHEAIERFEVGDDVWLDQRLAWADLLGSIAHARMLGHIGVLTREEAARLEEALRALLGEAREGRLALTVQDEDIHTRVEGLLVERLGDLGKKLHTGRSRNDQVLVDLRLYTKRALLDLQDAVLGCAGALLDFAARHRDLPMPGYTHMQRAMLSSVGLWAGAFVEALLDDLTLCDAAYRLNDQSPLGSAAGYGVPLPLDRAYAARLLGFRRVQPNVLYVQNSRGKFELAALQAAAQVAVDLAKLAEDLLLFTTREFGFFRVAQEMATGSSLMPQKRNLDAVELVRARCRWAIGLQAQVGAIVAGCPSGYNGDLQETKRPLMEGLETVTACLNVMALTVAHTTPDPERLAAACTPEIFAADAALQLAAAGVPFRDAYRQVATGAAPVERPADLAAALARRSSEGAPGNLGLERARARWSEERIRVQRERERFDSALAGLAGP